MSLCHASKISANRRKNTCSKEQGSGFGIAYNELFWKNKLIAETEKAKGKLFSRLRDDRRVLFSAMTESYRENDRHYSFSLTGKHDNFAFLVFDNADPNLPWWFAYSSIPEKTVRLFA